MMKVILLMTGVTIIFTLLLKASKVRRARFFMPRVHSAPY